VFLENQAVIAKEHSITLKKEPEQDLTGFESDYERIYWVGGMMSHVWIFKKPTKAF
jgi:hypothetical protein